MLNAYTDEMVRYYWNTISPEFWFKMFWGAGQEKSPRASLTFQAMEVANFRGVRSANIAVSPNNLTLLLGLNESGKTSVLKAMEAFDFRNDPDQNIKGFFGSFRNRTETWSDIPVRITCRFSFANPLDAVHYAGEFRRALAAKQDGGITEEQISQAISSLNAFIERANQDKSLEISRVIPFEGGEPLPSYYEFKSPRHPFAKTEEARLMAQAIVRDCPQIFYFEDFKDMVPDRIFVQKNSDGFNSTWYEIIDGLFYSTDRNLNIGKFVRLFGKDNFRKSDADTVIAKVNNTLNQRFTKKWKQLSGVEGIGEAKIEYEHAPNGGYFSLSIRDKDGTTYTVNERSKGAVWYLGFLMKAEFRRKKLRSDMGKTVYLIDEPASNLHSTAQGSMLDDFSKMVEDASVIYTTHSQHLVSPENMKTTYVVKRSGGKVSCIRWGDYIKGKSAEPTYYQPLADCLNIKPSSLDLGWKKALIVEGPSDRHILMLMHEAALKKEVPFAIYVAGSAGDMKSLISINLGWAADFRVLLDADEEGVQAAKKYCRLFSLKEGREVIVHPEETREIEKYFPPEERMKLRILAFPASDANEDRPVKKTELRAIFALLLRQEQGKKVGNVLSEETVEKFRALFQRIALD